MKITHFGHSALLIEVAGKRLLVDPYFSAKESMEPSAYADFLASLKPDYVLLTHAHFDHVGETDVFLQSPDVTFISNWEIVPYFANKGMKATGVAGNIGGVFQFPFGSVRLVTAVHSSVFTDGTSGGVPLGFVIQTSEGNVYLAGDTGLTMDMQLIPMFCKLDLAVLPIGGLFTMGVDDAVMAANMVKAKRVLGVHYDTFEPIKIDHDDAKKAFAKSGIELNLLGFGESLKV